MSTHPEPSPSVAQIARMVRKRFHLSSAHPELHKSIYLLCLPAALFALNALAYYHSRGAIRWERLLASGSYWGADTYVAPWISTLADLVATVVFVGFARSRRVRRSSKIATALLLTCAWLCTALTFLVID